MEEGVAGEDDLVVAVLHEPADAVLGVARRVEALDRDAADLEPIAVAGSGRDGLAVLAADDLQVGQAEFSPLHDMSAAGFHLGGLGRSYQLRVASRVVPVAEKTQYLEA